MGAACGTDGAVHREREVLIIVSQKKETT